MGSFAAELRACVGHMLGASPPEPEGDPLRFLREWLAERHLGLVPVDRPAGFAWAGPWLARLRTGGADHAVVMFGSPSGVLFDPSGAAGAGGVVEQGWVVSPLDPALASAEPAGDARAEGTVVALLLAGEAAAPLERVPEALAVAGRGLEGDRYAAGQGTFSGPGRGRELTLVEAEALDALELPWERARRNVVTAGVSLNALVGRRFRIDAAVCAGRRLAEPCAHLERLSGPGILRPLVHRGGLRADILAGGPIRLGDPVATLDAAEIDAGAAQATRDGR